MNNIQNKIIEKLQEVLSFDPSLEFEIKEDGIIQVTKDKTEVMIIDPKDSTDPIKLTPSPIFKIYRSQGLVMKNWVELRESVFPLVMELIEESNKNK